MLLGRVTGTVVASQKEPLMEGLTFLLVRQLAVDNTEANATWLRLTLLALVLVRS